MQMLSVSSQERCIDAGGECFYFSNRCLSFTIVTSVLCFSLDGNKGPGMSSTLCTSRLLFCDIM
jgi:hypothetical protein